MEMELWEVALLTIIVFAAVRVFDCLTGMSELISMWLRGWAQRTH